MILLAGGTGMLGKQVLPLLTGQRLKLRLLTSDPGRAPELESDLVEVVRALDAENIAVEHLQLHAGVARA